MKKVLLLLVFATILCCKEKNDKTNISEQSIENTYDAEDVVMVDGVVYFKRDMTKVSGIIHGSHSYMIPSESYRVENGIRNGFSNSWDEQGQKRFEGNYKEGKQDGIWRFWWPNGQLKAESIYENDMLNGKKRTWDRYGNLTSEEQWVNNNVQNSNQTNQLLKPKENTVSTSSNYKVSEKDNNYANASSFEVSGKQLKKAEAMFEKHLPNLLKSKGEGASIYNQHTYIGDFTNDNIDDIIICFVYGFGGTAIGGIEAAFYEVKNEEINVVAGFAPAHRFSIDEIKNGTVYATKILYAKDDSQCCPSIEIPFKLKYSDNKLTVIE